METIPNLAKRSIEAYDFNKEVSGTKELSFLKLISVIKKSMKTERIFYSEKELKRAFLAGYLLSEEGDNASVDKLEIRLAKEDYTYEVKDWQIWRRIKKYYDEYRTEIVAIFWKFIGWVLSKIISKKGIKRIK